MAEDFGGTKRYLGLLPKGVMEKKKGFYTADGRFIVSSHPLALEHKVYSFWNRVQVLLRGVPSLLFIGVCMFAGALSIMVLRMLFGVAQAFEDDPIVGGSNAVYASKLPMLLSTVWITIMNTVYRKIAVAFNDMSNFRTETEYNDALIIKTVIFQFINSYITLFYIAFAKANEWQMGAIFNNRDPDSGKLYRDMCGSRPSGAAGAKNFFYANVNPACNSTSGDDCRFVFVQGDCFEDLRILMISYTLLKPCYELPMQFLPSLIAKLLGQYRLLKQWAKQAAQAAGDGVKNVGK